MSVIKLILVVCIVKIRSHHTWPWFLDCLCIFYMFLFFLFLFQRAVEFVSIFKLKVPTRIQDIHKICSFQVLPTIKFWFKFIRVELVEKYHTRHLMTTYSYKWTAHAYMYMKKRKRSDLVTFHINDHLV